jgi:aspartyl-tRNA(Asn)/glutamyl-tRNA(Gln) amidotransferase subunit C
MFQRSDIEKLAALARITIPDEEKETLRKELDSIIAYVSALSDIQVSEEEKGPASLPVRNVFRDDEAVHESGVSTEAIMREAPRREGEYIAVKKILPQ